MCSSHCFRSKKFPLSPDLQSFKIKSWWNTCCIMLGCWGAGAAKAAGGGAATAEGGAAATGAGAGAAGAGAGAAALGAGAAAAGGEAARPRLGIFIAVGGVEG